MICVPTVDAPAIATNKYNKNIFVLTPRRKIEMVANIKNNNNTFFGFHLSDNQPPPIAPNIAPKFNTNRNNILEWSGYSAAVIRPGSQVFIPKIINKHIENPIHNIIVLSARPYLNNSATEFTFFS